MSKLRLMEYSTAWAQEFEQTKSSILCATEGLLSLVLHIGATAVPGALAAPTIDMMAGMRSLSQLNTAANLIEGLNFVRMPSPPWCDDELVAYLQKPRSGFPTHSVLLLREDGVAWNQCLLIRNHLRDHPADLVYLQNLKRELFLADSSEVDYQTAKSDHFQDLLSSLD